MRFPFLSPFDSTDPIPRINPDTSNCVIVPSHFLQFQTTFWFQSIFHYYSLLLSTTYIFHNLLLHSVWKSPKMSHLNFSILAFSTNFCPIKTDLSGNTVWPQTSDFQKLAKMTIFGIFDKLLSTQNVNVARFARNVKWDFICDFQTPCMR